MRSKVKFSEILTKMEEVRKKYYSTPTKAGRSVVRAEWDRLCCKALARVTNVDEASALYDLTFPDGYKLLEVGRVWDELSEYAVGAANNKEELVKALHKSPNQGKARGKALRRLAEVNRVPRINEDKPLEFVPRDVRERLLRVG
jgi:hypothetical protein